MKQLSAGSNHTDCLLKRMGFDVPAIAAASVGAGATSIAAGTAGGESHSAGSAKGMARRGVADHEGKFPNI